MLKSSEVAATGPGDREPPLISVIIAAYNRSHLLKFALQSVLEQTFADFEILVIGDSCTDDTEKVVAECGDERLRFLNLALNFGDQSGPNNVGIELSRGRYIAFLNQDDLWLPDHLETCLNWLQATGSDLVHGIAARVSVGPSGSNVDDWVAGTNPGRETFDPTCDFSACSTWLARREVFAATGGFRPSREIVTEPSQELLFRIWRQGLSHRRVPNLSVIVVPSGERVGSYVSAEAAEHEAIAKVLARPDFRSAILSRIGRSTGMHGSELWQSISSVLLWPMAWAGIPPRAVRLFLSGRFRRGSVIRHLRGVRGLEPVWHTNDLLSALKAREADLQESDVLGRRLEFAVGQSGGLYLEDGWSHPDPGGTWTNGLVANLRLPVRIARQMTALALEIEAIPFVSPAVDEQRLILEVNGRTSGQFAFGADSKSARMIFEIEREDGDILDVTFKLPDAHSPKANYGGGDRRKLGLFVRAITVNAVQQ